MCISRRDSPLLDEVELDDAAKNANSISTEKSVWIESEFVKNDTVLYEAAYRSIP